MTVLAAAIVAFCGLPPWILLLAIVFVACPIAAVWSYLQSARPLPVSVGRAIPAPRWTLNWLAPWYDQVCRRIGLGAAFRQRTLDLAGLRPGEYVLDAGCGTGIIALRAACIVGPSGRSCGIDAAPDMIRIAWERAGSLHCGAQFEVGVVESLPFPDDTFDVVFLSLVLHHLPRRSRDQALQEVWRVLMPGGRAVVVDLNWPDPGLFALWARMASQNQYLGNHLGGRTREPLVQAGFGEVARRGVWWAGLLGIWTARKSMQPARNA